MKPNRLVPVTILAAVCALAPFLLTGCIGIALLGARYVDEKVNPPQPVLRASAPFFDHAVIVSVALRPVVKRRLGLGALFHDDTAQDQPDETTAPKSPDERMAQWTALTNSGTGTVEFTVSSVDSLLGMVPALPKLVSLAPSQRVLLDPLRSARKDNLPSLEVKVILARGDTSEDRVLLLGKPPVVKFSARDTDGMAHSAAEPGARATVWVFIVHDCPICNGYAPLLGRLAAEYGPRGVRWRAVYAEPGLSVADLRTHARAYGLPGPLFADSGLNLARDCGITVTPEIAVFNSASQLVYRGRIDDLYPRIGQQRPRANTQDLRDALDQVIAGQAVAEPRTAAVGCALETPSVPSPAPAPKPASS